VLPKAASPPSAWGDKRDRRPPGTRKDYRRICCGSIRSSGILHRLLQEMESAVVRAWARAAPACVRGLPGLDARRQRTGARRVWMSGRRLSERARACPLTRRIKDALLMLASWSEAGCASSWLCERVTGFPGPSARTGEPANACLGIGRLSDHPHPLLFPDSPRWRHWQFDE
jgi:hypothetical protein